ncbi:MAG: NADH-quinone oxidoreductase subunit L [Gammaproteobacteria bacterium]|nr:NADH-quinone oxidoreductase subunit L [Gammaproteobacteria bacterium]NIN61482.1 NADH-quinone oxidoreductase subunit L [Gammaproteobacteria bacterium]NIO61249.1 NADH-quinone oxidoreductase subunit L [Gammaproteobacteria bacterium]NIQ19251.1 NADH-quinone oxidoreductase subunit L [Gammaproteobacteria bacterium]NIT05311.1 NADH-quinone oxidoreductase subunit L [Gammaproteobacteria bacterium]
MESIYIAIVLSPLVASIIAGLFGKAIGRSGAHWVTIIGVGISSILSLIAYKHIIFDGGDIFNGAVYQWLISGGISLEVGFLVDRLTVTMMVVVSFVSWMIHIYTIGYMHDDPGYQRFFSYISLFTFSMLMLVMSNNFMQLFFGWEAVGLVSYLLIGFWYKRESAIFANLKAFLVNRVGDFGFILGIAAILMAFNTLDYWEVFNRAPVQGDVTISLFQGYEWSLMTVICISLFIGAMGKSAQFPLHVWLPDSMEGPTPISALIHAATMVTAGIFMVARMSPLFELSETALNFILIIGAITAFFMGLLGLVQNDIKRVIAYSTLSQLGYMTVALGASAYAAAIFHLVTHAFFKALLFLAAGAVIIVLHHEQDIRKMGGLYKYMPITWLTCLIGALALIGFPGFSGFFSKDAIIEAVHLSTLPAADFAYYAVMTGVVITALYTFRLFFLVFHGKERMDKETWSHLHEAPAVIWVPLSVLAVPSFIIGFFLVGPMLFSEYFADAIYVAPAHNVLAEMGQEYHGIFGFIHHAFKQPPVYLAFVGLFLAWLFYIRLPDLPKKIAGLLQPLYFVLVKKYGMDEFNQIVFAGGVRRIGNFLWDIGDVKFIDGLFVNGSALSVQWFSGVVRKLQSGYLYHYAFAMIFALLLLIFFFVHN